MLLSNARRLGVPALGVLVSAPCVLGQPLGQWGPVMPWDMVAVHMVHLPTGKILAWGFDGSQCRVYDPVANTLTPRTSTAALFCAGHAGLEDGRILVAGGGTGQPFGYFEVSIFDPFTESWSRVQDLIHARWYPTLTTMGDGRVVAMSGNLETGAKALIPEVYDPATQTWTALPNASRNTSLYPFNFLLPDGRLGSGGSLFVPAILDIDAQSWQTRPTGMKGGSAVMYAPGKVMKSGGDDPNVYGSLKDAAVIDFSIPGQGFQAIAPMHRARRRHNLCLLPDGTVLCTGGTGLGNDVQSAVYEAELWDPATMTWTLLPSMAVPRMYHSSTILLPDGRVLSAGGNDRLSAEIYSPAYLFRGPRPVVTEAPRAITYTGTFTVRSPDAHRVSSVTLLRLGAVTHAFDSNQRFMELSFTPGLGELVVDVPESSTVAPPGFYMVFVIDDLGVPSMARYVRLSRSKVCPGDLDDNHVLDIFDFLAFQNLYAALDPRADLDQSTGAGVFDIFDFLAFQNLFAQGCGG